MRRWRGLPDAWRLQSSMALLSRMTAGPAPRFSVSPSGVRATRRLLRSNSGPPSVRSSALMASDTED